MPIAFAVVLLLVGLVHLAFPYASWYMSIGWTIRDAEPSDAYLILSRVGGGIFSAIGLIILVVGIAQTTQQQAHKMDEWAAFEKEMTVKNISSIREQAGGTAQATPAEIQEFVQDIQGQTAELYGGGNTFSAMSSYVITCRDGYQASLINVDNNGTFGMASGSAWLAPDFEFTSDRLGGWALQLTASNGA